VKLFSFLVRNEQKLGVFSKEREVDGVSSIILYLLAEGIGGKAEYLRIFTSLLLFCRRLLGFTQTGFRTGDLFNLIIMLVKGSWSRYSRITLGLRFC